VNVSLAVFNLVPGFPLDGGRILRALAWMKTGSLTKSTKLASDMGKGFAVALMFLGGLQIFSGSLIGGFWLIFIGMFLRGVAEGGYREVVMKESLEDIFVHDIAIRDAIAVPPDISLEGLVRDYLLVFGYGGFPVVRDGKAIGVVSLSNVKAIPPEEQAGMTVGEVMTPLGPEITVGPEESLTLAMRKMNEGGQGRLLVMRGDEFVGMITKTGVMRVLEIKSILGR
jgi:CBS domain-containing protein